MRASLKALPRINGVTGLYHETLTPVLAAASRPAPWIAANV